MTEKFIVAASRQLQSYLTPCFSIKAIGLEIVLAPGLPYFEANVTNEPLDFIRIVALLGRQRIGSMKQILCFGDLALGTDRFCKIVHHRGEVKYMLADRTPGRFIQQFS